MATRNVIIRLEVKQDPVDGECPSCGFDAMLRVRAYHLTSSGVTTLADRTLCVRCAAEERRMSTPDL